MRKGSQKTKNLREFHNPDEGTMKCSRLVGSPALSLRGAVDRGLSTLGHKSSFHRVVLIPARFNNFVDGTIIVLTIDDAETGFKPILTTKAVSTTNTVYKTVAGSDCRA